MPAVYTQHKTLDMPSLNAFRKRGRPSKYGSKKEKAAADVQRKRTKRQQEQVAQQHDFYPVDFTSALPSRPPAMSRQQPDQVGQLAETSVRPAMPYKEPTESTGFEEQDLSFHLPPCSPLLRPIAEDLTEQTDGTSANRASPLLAQSEADFSLPGVAHSLANDTRNTTTEEQEVTAVPETDDTNGHDAVQRLAGRMMDQLAEFKGCCHDCHHTAQADHNECFEQHTSLQAYSDTVANLCPDILDSKRLALQEDDLFSQTTVATRRQIYSGLASENESNSMPHICLAADERRNDVAGISFDVDSVTGISSSIAVAKQGIRWHPTQMPVSDLRSSLHLRSREVHFLDEAGRAHTVHRPIHQIPHYTFGRLVGFEDISLYLLFPHLYREDQQSSRLRDRDFQLWMDGVLLPIIYDHYSGAHVQHYPSSYDHSRYNATARGVETHAQRVDPIAREQQISSYLPWESLAAVWEAIQATVRQPAFHHFQDVTILLQAKNLKVLTKDFTWELMMTRFQNCWTQAIDERYVTPDFYFDIGKEVCPPQASHIAAAAQDVESPNEHRGHGNETSIAPAETLLWKRCCLESYATSLQHAETRDLTRKQVFYPFSMLHDSGSLTIETSPRSWSRGPGLLYSQFYPSAKEIFAAGNVYPFTNTAMETLALDKKLRKTWELVGGGLSHNPVALMKAYLHTRLRCHYALRGSVKKSFGVREEHRVSRTLFYSIDKQFRSRHLYNQRLTSSTSEQGPYYSFTTATLLRWVRWNINKFCVGFETVYSFQDPHFVTWEHTRIMLMFLRCLQFSYSGGLIQKAGGCWQDVRHQPDSRQPDGLRRVEGLGFRRTMEQFGYAWFLDKIDWETMTFRQPHSPYMMFNNPSMQAACRARYSQIRDVRLDFIRADKARQWMIEFSAVPASLDLLEKYLRQLCLCGFRKDVFTHIKSALHPDQIDAALAGQTPLCYNSVKGVLKENSLPIPLAHGHRLAVKSVDVLFTWLWEWNDGKFERKGWNEKPYRMLYQQSFRAVTAARGKADARAWRQELKKSFLRSHWMLPYPQSQGFMRKDKDSKNFVWWPTFHQGLHEYYQQLSQYEVQKQPFPASHLKHYPSDGWKLAPRSSGKDYMPYVVHPEQRLLHLSETELYNELIRLREEPNVPTGTASPSQPVRKFEIRSSRYIEGPARWCSKTRALIPMTIKDCKSASEYSMFLRKELEKYELLHHHGRNLRRHRQPRQAPSNEFDSGSGSDRLDESSPLTDETSDEESMVAKRRHQAKTVKRIEKVMRAHIIRDRDRSGRPTLYQDLEKEFDYRSKQVE